MQHSLPILIFLVGWIPLSEAMAQEPAERVLAKAGNRVITESEFQERFELLPRRLQPGDDDQLAAKEELVLSLIAEKLLAQEAVAQGYDTDPQYLTEIESVRKRLARDQLYRVEVQQKVDVTTEEIQNALPNARRSLLIRYAYAPDSSLLSSLLLTQSRKTSDPIDDSRMYSIQYDTITVNWGEAERALDSVVFSLQIGETSSIVPSSVGWFKCVIVDELSNESFSRLGPLERREHVARILRLRKEERRLDEYVRDIMRSSKAKAKRVAFESLVTHIRDYVRSTSGLLAVGIGPQDRDVLVKNMGMRANDTLLVMNNMSMTVAEVLDRLTSTVQKIPSVGYPELERTLNSLFRTWTWQAVLESVAVQRGMDAYPEVDRQIQMWKDHYLAETVRRRMMVSSMVSDWDMYRYRKYLDPSSIGPVADVEIAWSLQQSAVSEISQPNEASLTSASQVSLTRLEKVDLTKLGNLSQSLMLIPEGEWTPILPTDSGFVIGRVVGQIIRPFIAEDERDSLKEGMRILMGRRAETLLLSRIADSRGYSVYEENVRSVKVSSVPMMSFRMLGFGGRMFAVPFVRPRVEWYSPDTNNPANLP